VGFEESGWELGGSMSNTARHPGRPRNAPELRADLEQAFALIPGKHRLTLHASYAESLGRRADRDALTHEHFHTWMTWAKDIELGLDFCPTFFAHPLAGDGFTLSHRDPSVRQFWVEHGRRSRDIGAKFARLLGTPSLVNFWVPDGYKDKPADRLQPRERLEESLDMIFAKPVPNKLISEALEPKLFGVGTESYVVGSHEFYLGYALSRHKLLCLDTGHYHPTEQVADKLSALLRFLPGLVLHLNRSIRWDSNHVVLLSEDLLMIAQEMVRGDFLKKVHIGLDFSDSTINRVAGLVLGARSVLKAFLWALLEPVQEMQRREAAGDLTGRLTLMEEIKTMPFGAVWNHYCESQNVPRDHQWLSVVQAYERQILARRG
jgi:L-rhamnose isomerase